MAPSSAACAGDGSGRSSPTVSAKSSASALNAPDSEMIAVPRSGSRRPARQQLGEIDQLLEVSTTATPAWLTSACITA